jgi:hypothetical protein
MNRSICTTTLSTAMAIGAAVAQQANNAAPAAVLDEATAVQIAEKALARVYGKKKVASERPFTATLRNGIWYVGGTLYCKDEHGKRIVGACIGGVAMADVRQSDGRVLKATHTK